jgi:Lrp/AsnC family transcriptional regulator for asnA, asnC and gidA
MLLDEIGIKLIQELQKDSRQSNRTLAKKLHVSEGTIRKRFYDLRQKALIRPTVIPNPQKLGYSFVCVMGIAVKLTDLKTLSNRLKENPHVFFLAHVTGQFDLIAVLLFKDTSELAQFYDKELSLIQSITKTETFASMYLLKSPWDNDLDIKALAERAKNK